MKANKKDKKIIPTEASLRTSQKTTRFFLPEIIIFITAFLIYSNTLNHEYAFDDDVITKKNYLVQKGTGGISEIFQHSYTYGFDRDNSSVYRPLIIAMMAVEVGIVGNSPKTHHLINVLLYGFSCVLFYWMLLNLFALSSGGGLRKEFAQISRKTNTSPIEKKNFLSQSHAGNQSTLIIILSMVFLFITHPIHTEVVANIKSRDEILCFMFAILSLSSALHYFDKEKISSYLMMMVFFFMAVLTKETGITFSVMIPVTLLFFRGKKYLSLIKVIAGLGVVVLVYLLLRAEVLDKSRGNEMKLINNSLVAAKSLSVMIPSKICLLGKYLSMLFYPHPLSHDYSFNQIPARGWGDAVTIINFTGILTLFLYGMFFLLKKDALLYCVIFFLVTLSPVSNLFFLISASFAERFLFLPSVGFCIGLPLLLERAKQLIFQRGKSDGTGKDIKKNETGKDIKKNETGSDIKKNEAGKDFKKNETGNNIKKSGNIFFILIISVIVMIFSTMTISRNPDWKNNVTLFAAGVKNSPNSFRTHAGYADQFRVKGEVERNPELRKRYLVIAIEEYKKSIAILEDTPPNWYNLGVCYYMIDEKENAKNAYKKTIALEASHKDALNNLGVIYFEKRQFAEAQECFEKDQNE